MVKGTLRAISKFTKIVKDVLKNYKTFLENSGKKIYFQSFWT